MKPVINLEDPIGKTVGRRAAPADTLKYGLSLQRSLVELGGRFAVRRGVYRFHSFEEANEWMMNAIIHRTGD